jgi:uncharacterized protein YqeY
MSIVKTISDAYMASVKSKDEARRDILKLIKSEFMKLEKAPGKAPGEPDFMGVLTRFSKNLKQTAIDFPVMAPTVLAEAAILDEYIPHQMSKEEVSELLDKLAVEQSLVFEKKNMGTIVKLVVTASGGATDGKTVSELVSKRIS